MLSETMRTPTGIFFTTLLGVFALLFGFGIVVVLSGALPDILADLDEAARALSLIAPLALSVTTKQASNSSTDQGGGKRRWEGIELDQCSAKWALQFSLSLKEDTNNDQVDGVIDRVH